MMIRMSKLNIMLSSLFLLFFITSAYAEDKLIKTPYFQVKLPAEFVQSKINTLLPTDTAGLGKGYTFLKSLKNDSQYIIVIFIEDFRKVKVKDKQQFLVKDVKETYSKYIEIVKSPLKDSDANYKINDVKIGKFDFKVLRTADSRMETWATVYNDQFYRILVTDENQKGMDSLHKLLIETLQLTDTKVQEDIQ